MSRTSDILNRAQSLREKHQNDIDEKLIADMRSALKDTENFVKQRVNTISNGMHQEIEQTQQSLKDNLQRNKTSIQASINTMGQNLSKDTQAMQENLQIQIQSMQKDLQTLNGLSQAIVEQTKRRKGLIFSNTVLISIAVISLITSICLGYVSKSKYNDISAMQMNYEYLKSKGANLNLSNCDNQICVEIDTSKPEYQDGFRIVKEIN